MLSYVDTSALVKLVIDEEGSDAVWSWVGDEPPATCRISWVEARSALARRERELPAAAATWAAARAALAEDWPRLRVIELTPGVAQTAGDFAEAFALRAYDAVQLAAAHALTGVLAEPVQFLAFDRRLNRAARLLGLHLPDGAPV